MKGRVSPARSGKQRQPYVEGLVMKTQLHGIRSTVICASCAFVVFWFIGLIVLAFGPGRSPTGQADLLMLMLVYPALLSACVALGHAAGLWVSGLVADPAAVSYALRFPIWAAVLSIVGAFGIRSVPSTAPTGALSGLLLFAVCGCVVTTSLRLAVSRWMIKCPRP